MFSQILLASDGEPHTEKATDVCLELARMFDAYVTVIHVMDPYLKQFYNEIYAQGRKEYLEHIDTCLRTDADRLEKRLKDIFEPAASKFLFLKSYGDPEQEILKELNAKPYDLLITGGKLLTGIKKITSWNLPSRLEMKSPGIPVLVCRA